jgi:CRISPR-associated protein Cmr1
MGMTRLEAYFRIVTPLFMGGANPQSAELRVPSIKGVLRFWWRALALGRLGSVESVRAEEARVFGSTKSQSSFKIRLSPPKITTKNRLKRDSVLNYISGEVVGEGFRYLGYGVIEAGRGKLTRQCIRYPLEEDGKLELLFRPNAPEDDIRSVEAALMAMGFFGGLGSRSRRGYGSFNLVNLKRDDVTDPLFTRPNDLDVLKKAILSLFNQNGRYKITLDDKRPPYTAFSKNMRVDIIDKVDVGDKEDEPLKLLNSIGEKMMDYRSYLKSKTFYDDHHLLRDAISGKQITNHPRRIIFGLPNNYHFRNGGGNSIVKPKAHERRASPLFIHIQQLNKDRYAAIAAIIPADFLPRGEKIMVENSSVDVNEDYGVLNVFIDGNGTPRFASKVRVI